MGVDAVLVLMLVGCYLLVVGISIYYRIKFDKEMQKKTWSLDQVFFMQFDILKQSFAIGYINV